MAEKTNRGCKDSQIKQQDRTVKHLLPAHHIPCHEEIIEKGLESSQREAESDQEQDRMNAFVRYEDQ